MQEKSFDPPFFRAILFFRRRTAVFSARPAPPPRLCLKKGTARRKARPPRIARRPTIRTGPYHNHKNAMIGPLRGKAFAEHRKRGGIGRPLASAMRNIIQCFPLRLALQRAQKNYYAWHKHTLFAAFPLSRAQIYSPSQAISLRLALMALFSSRETCACEMPTSPEISVCVLPS